MDDQGEERIEAIQEDSFTEVGNESWFGLVKIVVATLFAALLYGSVALAGEADVKGSKDHPLLTRMPDFHITAYKVNDFDQYGFLTQQDSKTRQSEC